MYIREISNYFGEFWGTLFWELQETRGNFPKFPKIYTYTSIVELQVSTSQLRFNTL